MDFKFIIKEKNDSDGIQSWYWILVQAVNGKPDTKAMSTDSYKNKEDCLQGISDIIAGANSAISRDIAVENKEGQALANENINS